MLCRYIQEDKLSALCAQIGARAQKMDDVKTDVIPDGVGTGQWSKRENKPDCP